MRSTGLRRFRSSVGERREARYALAPRPWVIRTADGNYVVELQIRLHVSHPDGRELDDRIAFRRQKRITKMWFNHEWRIRVLAVCNWLGQGADVADLSCGTGADVRLAVVPSSFLVDQGIDEAAAFLGVGKAPAGSAPAADLDFTGDDDTELPDVDVDEELGEDSL